MGNEEERLQNKASKVLKEMHHKDLLSGWFMS